MTKIKVLLCQEAVSRGGVERRKLSVARFLDKEKYEIKLLCTSAHGAIVNEFEELGVEIVVVGEFKGVFDLSQYAKVSKIVKRIKPDIIHGAVFQGVALACVCGYLNNVPVIIAEETSDPQNRSVKASILLRLLTTFADKVIAIAPAVADYLSKTAKIKQSKICLINNGVELPRVVTPLQIDELKMRYGITNELIIGSAGRLHNDHKRFTDILKAVSLLKDNKGVKIMILGGGNDKELIRQTAIKLAIEDKLILTDHQHDTAPFYQMMDIFCLASQREGFGLVAAEAMLHKLPVIATNVGGLKNVVQNNVTGFLIPALKPDELASKIQAFIDNPGLRQTMGEAGYTRAVKEYSAPVYAKKVENLYQDLLTKKKININ